MAGRLTDRAVEKENKKNAHNGTAYFTSTDAHRGCLPTYRGDYEILGHNLLAWLGGLDKLPWKNSIKKLDEVYRLKSQYVENPKLVYKIVPEAKGGKLISGAYELAAGSEYNDTVDNSLMRKLLTAKSRSTTESS